MSPNRDAALLRAVGVWGLAASIVNITVGGGIFRLPAGAARSLGAAAPVAYLVCALAMGLIVLCFAEAGSRVSLTGGLYAYTEIACGPLIGFVCGVLLWAGLTAAFAAVSSFFADALAALVPALGPRWARGLALAITLAGLATLNVRGVAGATRFNAVMTIAKLLPLALLIVAGVAAIRVDNLTWTTAPAPGAVARTSVLLIFAFLGVETALVPSGEVKDPARTVPRAIFIAMLGITILYLAVQLVAQGILGPALAQQETPLAAAAAVALGPAGRQIILIGSVVSMFGYISGMTLAVPRMLYAFARDGFLLSGVAAVHPRFRTPYMAIAIQAAITLVLAVTGTFETLAIISNGSVLLVYGVCCLSVLELRRRDVRAGDAPFRAPGLAIVPLLATAMIVWFLTSLERREWAALGAVALGAAVVHIATRSRRLHGAVGSIQEES